MPKTRHPTTRRGFIAAMGFGGVSLYGLWAAYGAAPGPLELFAHADRGTDDKSGGDSHGGHGAASSGAATETFRRSASEFIDRYRLPDGSVHPRRLPPAFVPETASDTHSLPTVKRDRHTEAGHAAPVAPSAADHGDRHGGADAHGEKGPIEVYLLAEKWFYQPAHLRLDVGVAYRFRMMAVDVSHGASIQFGRGSRMIRLRPGSVTEMDASFTRPGSYLVYCTVYCGQAHDSMQARIDVA